VFIIDVLSRKRFSVPAFSPVPNAALKKMVSPRLWPQCSPSASLNPHWRLTPAF